VLINSSADVDADMGLSPILVGEDSDAPQSGAFDDAARSFNTCRNKRASAESAAMSINGAAASWA
jgi:hypothetical protein